MKGRKPTCSWLPTLTTPAGRSQGVSERSINSVVRYKCLDFLGYIGYRIGDDNSLWSRRQRKGLGPGKGTTTILGNTWKRLKLATHSYGYSYACMRVQGRTIQVGMHRLLLLAFIGPCPEGMWCRHLDGNPKNNQLDNLCWGTIEENHQDRIRHGTNRPGEENFLSKLTNEQVFGNSVLVAIR